VSTEPADDFGATLRRAREDAGRSLRDLAEATKLGVRTLEALERSQIDRLPPGIFRRSVVRAYAREVGLDPEATLKAFLARHPDQLPPPGVTSGPIADVAARTLGWSRATVLSVVVAILLGLAAACWAVWRPGADVSRGGRDVPARAAVAGPITASERG
jgi:cytoskeleton protein RodZ